MTNANAIYIIPCRQMWRIEYDDRLCDEAETLDGALAVGRFWAKKLCRFLFLKSDDRSATLIRCGAPLFVVHDEPLPESHWDWLQLEICVEQRQRAIASVQHSTEQRERSLEMRRQTIAQRERLRESRIALA